MGRKSEYKDIDCKAQKKAVKELAAKKFLKESMNPTEFAAICEVNFPEITMNEKTVRINIKKLCDNSDGGLKLEYFKNNKGRYSIKPEVQAILMILIVRGTIDGRESDKIFNEVKERTMEVFNDIERYFSKEDIEYLKQFPFYNNCSIEAELVDYMSKLLANFFINLNTAEPDIRVSVFVEACQEIKKLNDKVYKCCTTEYFNKILFAPLNPESVTLYSDLRNDDFVKQMHYSQNWRELLINFLIVKANNLEFKVDRDIELNKKELEVLYYRYIDILEGKSVLNSQTKYIIDENKYLGEESIEIAKKIRGVLNLKNSLELEVYYALLMYLSGKQLSLGLSKKSYEKISNLILAADYRDESILEDFCNELRKLIHVEVP